MYKIIFYPTFTVYLKNSTHVITRVTAHEDGEFSVIQYNRAKNPEALIEFEKAESITEGEWINIWRLIKSYE